MPNHHRRYIFTVMNMITNLIISMNIKKPAGRTALQLCSSEPCMALRGISHFLLILPTLALPSMRDSVIYLSEFAVGTILTMVTYALILGIVAQKTADFPKSKVFRNLRIVAGSLAIAVGIWWLM
jgi:hypothetical protein